MTTAAEGAASHGTDGPEPGRSRWRYIGPGLVAAATGVGVGDLGATLLAGSRFGYTLLWAAAIGTLVKISLAEAVGRWHLATGRTIFQGWQSLGVWTTVYFSIYAVIWGFVFGATAMTTTGLPLAVLFGGPAEAWGIGAGVLGFAFVWFNRYATFERAMTVLVGVMFVSVVGSAVLVAPDLGALIAGFVPSVPDGAVVYTLGLIGGVGGTITMAAYGYWVNAKGWRTPAWIRVMRLDNRVGYLLTGVFVMAMIVLGAELLFIAEIEISPGGAGLVELSDELHARLGGVVATTFLIGFAATAFSSLLGVWNGVSLLFADFVASSWPLADDPGGDSALERGWAFRGYLMWLTFPPIVLVMIGEPAPLILAYTVLGAVFMPFLAGTLLWLLNRGQTPVEWRSGWVSNGMLGIAVALFTVLTVTELAGS
jgi:Mn2+/Fe2+ NRAMP family transporter